MTMTNGFSVIVFDRDGRVRSASSGAALLFPRAHIEPGVTVEELFKSSNELGPWLVDTVERTRASGIGDACFVHDDDDGSGIDVRVEPTSAEGDFVLVGSRPEPPSTEISTVSQKTWHDIKNQLGGLKLYVTFLKMKLATDDATIGETTAKIVGGIDAIVRSIGDARRGDERVTALGTGAAETK